MKLLRFLPVSLFMAVLFLFSCNGNEEKKTTDTMSSDSAVTTAPPTTPDPPKSTISTAEQNIIIVKHKVANYAKWKMSYDAHDSMRLSFGVHSYVIGRGAMDTNMVMVVTKVDDLAKAKAFAKDPSLKQAMQKGGVVSAPSVSFVTITYMDSAVTGPLRSITTFEVKDWAAWQKAFMEGNQERIDNGIMLRAYGHDADLNNKVTLVTAIMDTAKASAYWKSDMLKKRREAAGVISTPSRFIYNVAQRY